MSTAGWVLLLAALIVLCTLRPVGASIARAARALAPLATTPQRAILVVGLVSLATSSAMLCYLGPPLPHIHDEYAYLLGADTFASGRLSNPPHPMWRHFETFHVLQQPSYMPKYPPGQALALAVGQVLTGVPIVGVVASTALGAAAVCWMLLAWTPRRWALCGGLLAAVHPLLLQWSWSYWGGNVALLGGALVGGALGRLRRGSWGARDMAAMMLGVWVLAVSRPFEGMLVAAPILAAAVVYVAREPDRRRRILRGWGPLALGLSLTAASIGYYNHRVTGDALTMPYQVHDRTYAIAPPFVWQPLRSGIEYRDPMMRDYYLGRELPQYELHQTPAGLLLAMSRKVSLLAESYFNPGVLAVPFLVSVGWALGRRAGRRLVLLALGLSGLALTSLWALPHYFAPAGGLFFLALTTGARRLSAYRPRGRAVGRALVRATVLASVTALGLKYVAYAALPRPPLLMQTPLDRRLLLSRLASLGGRHLVLVRYGEHHSPHNEWVYNAADIDASRVVWARELSPPENRALLDYYHDRRAWLARVDRELVELVPYPEGGDRGDACGSR